MVHPGTTPRYFANSFCLELMLPQKADLVIIEQASNLVAQPFSK